MIKIAVDTMGGDYGPEITIPAVLNFLSRQDDVHCLLFGNQDEIMKHLPQSKARISVINTENEVTDQDAPLKVVQSKPRSSLVIAIQYVADYNTQASVFFCKY